jgi:catechol 2,3-dioxygenase-like lactoylglutathione lyase family enzyme
MPEVKAWYVCWVGPRSGIPDTIYQVGRYDVLDAPRFHHLHLNSVDPDRAIDFYVRQFSSTSRTTWGGCAALASPNDVLILFTPVSIPPPTAPDTAIWHFGWHVTDSRASLETYRAREALQLLPLYRGDDDDGSVLISSDTWPGAGGTLGRTRAQIADARASGIQPTRSGGFAYMQGPDGAVVEYAGNHPAERFNHVHMWQEDPHRAQLWYQHHLNAELLPGARGVATGDGRTARGTDRSFPSLAPEGMFRTPSGGVAFGDVWLPWYMRQGDQPLAPTRGHVYDHFALSVTDLDAWAHKLKAEGVSLVEGPYQLGDTRAVTINGPSEELVELVEAE